MRLAPKKSQGELYHSSTFLKEKGILLIFHSRLQSRLSLLAG